MIISRFLRKLWLLLQTLESTNLQEWVASWIWVHEWTIGYKCFFNYLECAVIEEHHQGAVWLQPLQQIESGLFSICVNHHITSLMTRGNIHINITSKIRPGQHTSLTAVQSTLVYTFFLNRVHWEPSKRIYIINEKLYRNAEIMVATKCSLRPWVKIVNHLQFQNHSVSPVQASRSKRWFMASD